MEPIPILTDANVDDALRRYVTATALFESTCAAMLERDGCDMVASAIVRIADAEYFSAGASLEAALQGVIASRTIEAISLAGLLDDTPAPRSHG